MGGITAFPLFSSPSRGNGQTLGIVIALGESDDADDIDIWRNIEARDSIKTLPTTFLYGVIVVAGGWQVMQHCLRYRRQ